MIHNNILETIGNTPMIDLERIVKKHKLKGKIYAKIEFYSPGMSKKDRIAKYVIEKAELEGTLKKGQHVIEQTSGNTGIGLAAVCAIKGYPFIAVMSEGNSIERVIMIKQFGAKVVLVPQGVNSVKGKVSQEDIQLVEDEYNRLAKELSAFQVGQFHNYSNALAHYHSTGKEIASDLPDLDAFVDFVGTGGTFEGISKRLKEHNAGIKCFIVEPTEQQHIIQGGGYFREVPFADPNNCDGKIPVSNEDALYWMNEMLSVEAIAGGISSGANLAACVKYLQDNPGKTVAFLVNDPSVKYMSSPSVQQFICG